MARGQKRRSHVPARPGSARLRGLPRGGRAVIVSPRPPGPAAPAVAAGLGITQMPVRRGLDPDQLAREVVRSCGPGATLPTPLRAARGQGRRGLKRQYSCLHCYVPLSCT